MFMPANLAIASIYAIRLSIILIFENLFFLYSNRSSYDVAIQSFLVETRNRCSQHPNGYNYVENYIIVYAVESAKSVVHIRVAGYIGDFPGSRKLKKKLFLHNLVPNHSRFISPNICCSLNYFYLN